MLPRRPLKLTSTIRTVGSLLLKTISMLMSSILKPFPSNFRMVSGSPTPRREGGFSERGLP